MGQVFEAISEKILGGSAMFFDFDFFDFLLAVDTDFIGPDKSDCDEHQKPVQSFIIGQMGGFEIKTGCFECFEHGFDLPAFLVILECLGCFFVRSDDQKLDLAFLIDEFKARHVHPAALDLNDFGMVVGGVQGQGMEQSKGFDGAFVRHNNLHILPHTDEKADFVLY